MIFTDKLIATVTQIIIFFANWDRTRVEKNFFIIDTIFSLNYVEPYMHLFTI